MTRRMLLASSSCRSASCCDNNNNHNESSNSNDSNNINIHTKNNNDNIDITAYQPGLGACGASLSSPGRLVLSELIRAGNSCFDGGQLLLHLLRYLYIYFSQLLYVTGQI